MVKQPGKYKDIFQSEAKQHIGSMNKYMLELEKNPGCMELVNNIFHALHTLKSMAATMEYNKIAGLCHSVEDVLDGIKKKVITVKECTDILFECFDILEMSLKEVSVDKEEPDIESLMLRLHTLTDRKEKEKTRDEKMVTPVPAETGSPTTGLPVNEVNEYPSPVTSEITGIDVKVKKLDLLMNITEELLINKMRFDKLKEKLDTPELTDATDALGKLIAELQYNVMQIRMVPIGFVFNRFPRMVRDLAKQGNKEVNLEIKGHDIELDRTIVEEIAEPLVHLLRNTVVHGIETQEEREKHGKPVHGSIRLAATRVKGLMNIEVADDGQGIDLKNIKNLAVNLGILSQEATGEEVMNAIFSNLSTTKEVTTVSGRGFGLNIAKKKVESLGGSIRVDSQFMKGTKFTIELPLTMAVIKALFVNSGGKLYAIPLTEIKRLVNVNKEDIKGMLQYEAIVLDGEDIPVTRLNVLFNVPSTTPDKQHIVITKGEKMLGLAVDAFIGIQEIILKPLKKVLRENRYFAGCSISSSGAVVPVIDVQSMTLSKRAEMQTTDKRPKTENCLQ